MSARVIVVGCGVGGTVVANRLARARPDLGVRVVDGHGDHVYQAGSLPVALGRGDAARLRRDARGLLAPRVALDVRRVEGIDLARRRVALEGGGEEAWDVLVLATGSRIDHRDAPAGLREGAAHFHCPRAATELAERVRAFQGGTVVVGAVRLPYKCPASPVEFALRLDADLRRRRLRDRTRIRYVYPLDRVLPDERLADWADDLLAERRIEAIRPFAIESIDPSARRIRSAAGGELDYDLLVLVPPHRGSPFLCGTGIADPAGWVQVDPKTLRAAPGVFCLGDAADLPAPKLGAAARTQARLVARNVLAELDGRPLAAEVGEATCLVETGPGRASRIDYVESTPRSVRRPNRLDFALRRAVDRFYFPMIARA